MMDRHRWIFLALALVAFAAALWIALNPTATP